MLHHMDFILNSVSHLRQDLSKLLLSPISLTSFSFTASNLTTTPTPPPLSQSPSPSPPPPSHTRHFHHLHPLHLRLHFHNTFFRCISFSPWLPRLLRPALRNHFASGVSLCSVSDLLLVLLTLVPVGGALLTRLPSLPPAGLTVVPGLPDVSYRVTGSLQLSVRARSDTL